MRSAPRARLSRILLLLLGLIPLALNVALTALRVEPTWPLNLWEPAMLSEGWRWSHGLEIYGSVPGGHASHMYGPLLTLLLAGLERLIGFQFPFIRLVFVAFGAAACLVLAAALSERIRSWQFFLAFVLLLSSNLQSGLCFAQSWADMPALFFAVTGVVIILRAENQRDWMRGLVGSALLVAAFLFKQTYAMATAGLVVLWLTNSKRRTRHGVWLFVPVASVSLTLLLLFVWFSPVFDQMVRVPASISVSGGRWLEGLAFILRGHPLFWLVAGMMAFGSAADDSAPSDDGWLWVGFAAVGLSAWTFAKDGGYYNSLLPAFMLVSAFCVRAFPQYQCRVPKPGSAWSAGLAAAAFLLTTCAGAADALWHLGLRHGDDKYSKVIEIAGRLSGKVVSPQDPSIVVQAKGVSGRSLIFELDNAVHDGQWPAGLPAGLAQEIADADWLIRVDGSFSPLLQSRPQLGPNWKPISVPELNGSIYSVWRNTKDPATPR